MAFVTPSCLILFVLQRFVLILRALKKKKKKKSEVWFGSSFILVYDFKKFTVTHKTLTDKLFYNSQ